MSLWDDHKIFHVLDPHVLIGENVASFTNIIYSAEIPQASLDKSLNLEETLDRVEISQLDT